MIDEQEFNKALGKGIKLHRKTHKISQEKFAQMIGCDRAYLSSIECAKANITIKLFVRILNLLNLEMEITGPVLKTEK